MAKTINVGRVAPKIEITKDDSGVTISATDYRENGTHVEQTEIKYADLKGEQGIQGEQGFSPTLKVIQTDSGVTITATDVEGNTTGTVLNNGAIDAYTKSEADEKFALKGEVGTPTDVYTKTESDEKFALKTELTTAGMTRYIIKLIKNGEAYSLVKYETNAVLTFEELRVAISDVNNYVVCVYGNSKLRPQYVSTNEMQFIGVDRDSDGAKVLRIIMTPTRLSYNTYELAEASSIYDDTALSNRVAVIEGKEASWDAKSDFSGSYNDLTDKPTIPDVASMYIFSADDLQAGVSTLEEGKLYFVYE